MKIPKLKQFTPIYVEWIDAGLYAGTWNSLGSAERDAKIVTCESVGFYLFEKHGYLSLCIGADRRQGSGEPDIIGHFQVPLGSIKKVRKLK